MKTAGSSPTLNNNSTHRSVKAKMYLASTDCVNIWNLEFDSLYLCISLALHTDVILGIL